MATKDEKKKKAAKAAVKGGVKRAAKRGGRRGMPSSDVKAGPGGRKTKGKTRRNAVSRTRVAKGVGGGRGGGR